MTSQPRQKIIPIDRLQLPQDVKAVRQSNLVS